MSLALELNEETKRAIERSTKVSFSELEKLDAISIDKKIEAANNFKLSFPERLDSRAPGRGSVYVAFNRFIQYTSELLDEAIDRIK